MNFSSPFVELYTMPISVEELEHFIWPLLSSSSCLQKGVTPKQQITPMGISFALAFIYFADRFYLQGKD